MRNPDRNHGWRGEPKAVLFDWTGTLVDFGCQAPVDAFLRLFAESEVEVVPADLRLPLGQTHRDQLETLMALPGVRERWYRKRGCGPDARAIELLYAGLQTHLTRSIQGHAELIPGVPELTTALRGRGIRIGSTSGYERPQMDRLVRAVASTGFMPEVVLCPDEVENGRPAPWMCFRAAERLGVHPMASLIKVGDTSADMQEGRNAGMWTIGVSLTGSLTGLPRQELEAVTASQKDRLREHAAIELFAAGAHYVVDGAWDVLEAVDEITFRMREGERP